MKFLIAMFAAMMAFYIYFVGYAAWFFFLDGRSEWAKAVAFAIMAIGIPVIPGLAWRHRTTTALAGLKSRAEAISLDSAATIDDNGSANTETGGDR